MAITSARTAIIIVSGNNIRNNRVVQQVGEEPVRGLPYRSLDVPADPWTQICYSSQKAPYGEYIAAVEQAFLNLEPHNTEDLRAEIRGALRHAHNPRRNITKEEAHTLA